MTRKELAEHVAQDLKTRLGERVKRFDGELLATAITDTLVFYEEVGPPSKRLLKAPGREWDEFLELVYDELEG